MKSGVFATFSQVAVTESLFRSLHARIEATDRLTVKVKQAVKQLEREQQSPGTSSGMKSQ